MLASPSLSPILNQGSPNYKSGVLNNCIIMFVVVIYNGLAFILSSIHMNKRVQMWLRAIHSLPSESSWYLACFSGSSNLCGIMSRNCWILSQMLGSFSAASPLSTLCMRAIMRATSGNTSASLHDVALRITPDTYSYANPLQKVAYRRGA